jgi:hypothetical protein
MFRQVAWNGAGCFEYLGCVRILRGLGRKSSQYTNIPGARLSFPILSVCEHTRCDRILGGLGGESGSVLRRIQILYNAFPLLVSHDCGCLSLYVSACQPHPGSCMSENLAPICMPEWTTYNVCCHISQRLGNSCTFAHSGARLFCSIMPNRYW